MKEMSFAAKIAALCVFGLLFAAVKLIIHMDFVRSETVVLDEKDGCIVFYTAGEQLYAENTAVSIETQQQTYPDVTVSEVAYLDYYVGKNQVMMYKTNLPAAGNSGASAVIRQSAGSLLDYIISGNTSAVS
ncbi:MAG: hypothetical protein IKI58_07480 [Oscillospiraceae bacterium]|nr:hypothetical protein [Oscillospiraceae bacterium]